MTNGIKNTGCHLMWHKGSFRAFGCFRFVHIFTFLPWLEQAKRISGFLFQRTNTEHKQYWQSLNQQPLQGPFCYRSLFPQKKKSKSASFASPSIRTTAISILNPSQPQTQTPQWMQISSWIAQKSILSHFMFKNLFFPHYDRHQTLEMNAAADQQEPNALSLWFGGGGGMA